MLGIATIVVIFNRTCLESETCKSLLCQQLPPTHVLVYDNSEKDMGNADFCASHGWIYLGGVGNLGLSKAYNIAIDYLMTSSSGCSYVTLLDDDTTIPDDFFATSEKHITDLSDTQIILPILSQQDKILSPWRDGRTKATRYFKTADECLKADPQTVLAFNSGMTICIDIFDNYRYDERLFLDGIDYQFLFEMKRQGKSIAVIPCMCTQFFSGNEHPELNAALARFRIYAKDFSIVFNKNFIKYFLLVGRRAFHLTLKYHAPKFVWIGIKERYKSKR